METRTRLLNSSQSLPSRQTTEVGRNQSPRRWDEVVSDAGVSLDQISSSKLCITRYLGSLLGSQGVLGVAKRGMALGMTGHQSFASIQMDGQFGKH